MAKPCYHCAPVIKAYGVRYVYYSNHDGLIEVELAKEMVSTHLSSGFLAAISRKT